MSSKAKKRKKREDDATSAEAVRKSSAADNAVNKEDVPAPDTLTGGSSEKKRDDAKLSAGSKRDEQTDQKEKSGRRRSSLHALLSSDKFMLALSFVTAFFIWVVMTVNSGETINYPVPDIPVTMELSQDAQDSNLTVVSVDGVPLEDFSATVKVKGNSVTVGSLSSGDIQVYGLNLGNIVGSGTYSVSLAARQLGVKNNYDIIAVSPSEVKVVVDRSITTEFAIEPQITPVSPVEYYIGATALSQQNVTVSGPEQLVSRAVKAIVKTDIESELTETTTITGLEVILIDSEGNEIDDDSIILQPSEVDATIPVLVKKSVPVTVSYLNAPAGFSSSSFVKIEPSEIDIAAPAEIIDGVSSISAGTIDLSTITYGTNSTTSGIIMPEGVKNLSGDDTAKITFNFSEYYSKSFSISDFKIENVPDDLVADHNRSEYIEIKVIGPQSEIRSMTSSDIEASIDLTNAKVGTLVVPVEITLNNYTSCWVTGTYTINVTVKNKSDVSSSS